MQAEEQFQTIDPPTIYVTTDYEKFKTLNYNRPINHLTKMSSSLSRTNKLYLHPIIVNKYFEIVDGQHRWAYAKEMQLPLYYVIDEYFEPSDLIAHNVTSSNWTSKDFAFFYATCNSKDFPLNQKINYSLCLEICQEFKISYDIFIRLFHQTKGTVAGSIEFKRGLLNFRLSKEEIISVMVQLEEISNYILRFKLTKKVNLEMYHALYHLMRLEGYDKVRMFKKFEENLDQVLNILKFRSSEEIFNRLLDVYNKNAKHRLIPTKKLYV